MRALDKKLLRDLGRLWAQLLAVALVMSCGIATVILSIGSYRALKETQAAFYGDYRFATVFASAVRAPDHLLPRIRAIDGVMRSEARIVKPVILDVPGMAEPATGIVVSLPAHRESDVNRLYLREGRLPLSGRSDEITVLESFAEAHRLVPGSRVAAIMNGRKRNLKIVGIVLTPEYIYAIGPGDMVPDPRRFTVFYMLEPTLAGVFGMEGAFNDLVLTTRPDVSLRAVTDEVDRLLVPYGGTLAITRKDQISHAFLDNELTELRGMAFVLPPIFLFVAAFLVHMILSRLIALEREQIGLLKAVGYGKAEIAWHYAKLVIAMALVGVGIGAVIGAWLGRQLAIIYSNFFSFPFLVFRESPDLYAISAVIGISAALAGAARPIAAILALPPAVAMRPPAPTRYRSLLGTQTLLRRIVSPTATMALRHLIRWPVRALLATIGVASSVALLVTSLFMFDAVNFMIETIFFRAERQDAMLVFAGEKSQDAQRPVAHLPGVMRTEAYRAVAVSMRHGHRKRDLTVIGLPDNGTLAQILDVSHDAFPLPQHGLVVSDYLASLLDLRPGDLAELELLEQNHRVVRAPVSAVVRSYVGLSVHMNLDALNRLVGDGARISGARVLFDDAARNDLFAAIKTTPALESITLLDVSRKHFRDTIEENIFITMTIYVVFAGIITFGVIYNSARIQLAEYARELASLRVLGFTRGEVSSVLLIELAVIVALAQPLGWLMGYGFALLLVKAFESDLFRIPFYMSTATFAWASIAVLIAAAASSLIVRRRVDRLDLVRALKTRE